MTASVTPTITPEEKDAARKAQRARKERERRVAKKAEATASSGKPAEVTKPKPAAKPKAEKPAKPESKSPGPHGFRPGGTPAEIYEVLKAARKPLHVKIITERVMKRGKANLKGKTPQATIAAELSVSVRKPDSPFVKVEKGVFGLR